MGVAHQFRSQVKACRHITLVRMEIKIHTPVCRRYCPYASRRTGRCAKYFLDKILAVIDFKVIIRVVSSRFRGHGSRQSYLVTIRRNQGKSGIAIISIVFRTAAIVIDFKGLYLVSKVYRPSHAQHVDIFQLIYVLF